MEHTTFDLHDVQLAVMAAERVGITPFVQTPGFDPAFILRLLDRASRASRCRVSVTARAAVKVVRYPPLGECGMAAGRPRRQIRQDPAGRSYGAVQPRNSAGLPDQRYGSGRA